MNQPLRSLLLAFTLGLCGQVGSAQESVAEKALALVRGELLAKASTLVSEGEVAVAHGDYVGAEKKFRAAEALLARAEAAPGKTPPKGRVLSLDDVTHGTKTQKKPVAVLLDDVTHGTETQKKRVTVVLEDVTHGEQASKQGRKTSRPSGEKKGGAHHGEGHGTDHTGSHHQERHEGHKSGSQVERVIRVRAPKDGAQGNIWVEADEGRRMRIGKGQRGMFLSGPADHGKGREALSQRVKRLEREITELGSAVRAFQAGMQRDAAPRVRIRDAVESKTPRTPVKPLAVKPPTPVKPLAVKPLAVRPPSPVKPVKPVKPLALKPLRPMKPRQSPKQKKQKKRVRRII